MKWPSLTYLCQLVEGPQGLLMGLHRLPVVHQHSLQHLDAREAPNVTVRRHCQYQCK